MDEKTLRVLRNGNITVMVITVLWMLMLGVFMTNMLTNVGSILTSIGGELPPLTRAVLAFTDMSGFKIASIALSGVLLWVHIKDGFRLTSLFANQIAFMFSFIFAVIAFGVASFVPLFNIIGRLSQF